MTAISSITHSLNYCLEPAGVAATAAYLMHSGLLVILARVVMAFLRVVVDDRYLLYHTFA